MDDLCQKVWNGDRITDAEALEAHGLSAQKRMRGKD